MTPHLRAGGHIFRNLRSSYIKKNQIPGIKPYSSILK
jgi:hypothetical protein